MAISHIAVRTHKRSAGHNVAAVLAYRRGTALVCPRTGEIHDYTRRSGVARCGTVAAVDTPLTQSLDALVAGIEGAERRRDSRISRDVQVALPCELSEPQNYELTQAFAKALAERYHTLASWAVHRPHRNDDGDPRNVHAHIVIPTRALDETGQLGRKLVELDHPKQSRDEIKAIRLLWEETANAALIEAGVSARVDVGRREDGDPAPTLGPTHAAVERKARRQLGHRTAGVPVAELVTDGQSVTGRGRRLEEHERRRRRRRVREQNTATRLLTPNEGLSDAGEVVLESLEAAPKPERIPPPAVRPDQALGATTAVRAAPKPERIPPPAVRPDQALGATTAVRAAPKPERIPSPAVRPDQALGATTAVRAPPKPERVPPPAVRPDQALGATTAVRAPPKPERIPSPAVRPGQALGATTAVRAVPDNERAPSPPVFTLTRRGHSGTLRGLHKLHQMLNRLRERETSLGQKAARVQAQTEVPTTPEEIQQAQEYLKGRSHLERPSLRTVIEQIAQARLEGTEAEAPETDEWRRQWSIRWVIGPHTKERPKTENPYELDTYNRGAVRSPKSAEAVARALDRALIGTCKEHYGPESPLGPPPAEHFHAFTAEGRKRKRMQAINNALRAWHDGFNRFMDDLMRIVTPHEVQIWRDRGREKRRDDEIRNELRQQRLQQNRHHSETTQRRKRDDYGIGD